MNYVAFKILLELAILGFEGFLTDVLIFHCFRRLYFVYCYKRQRHCVTLKDQKH